MKNTKNNFIINKLSTISCYIVVGLSILLTTGSGLAILPAETSLTFSWSPTSIINELEISESGNFKCYIWGRHGEGLWGFVGLGGNLIQTSGIQSQRWRFFISGNEQWYPLDANAAQQQVDFYPGECQKIIAERPLVEMEIFIDTSMMDLMEKSSTSIGFLPFPDAPYISLYPGSCDSGNLPASYEVELSLIVATKSLVANTAFSWGTMKALYR